MVRLQGARMGDEVPKIAPIFLTQGSHLTFRYKDLFNAMWIASKGNASCLAGNLIVEASSYPDDITTFEVMIVFARTANNILKRWVSSYEKFADSPYAAYKAFIQDWRNIRVFVPLQLRLAVEQICYEKGGIWKKVSTGFRPLE